jgi:glycosyltransferase involved in cell wall biosynthesis
MSPTTIRFVIPAKNEALLLPRLLASLEKQVTHHSWKVVVADANSRDKTCEIATAHGATVVKGGMPGPGRNAGANDATEEWLWFIDADGVFPSVDTIERAMDECQRQQADFATCRLEGDESSWLGTISHDLFAWYSSYTATTFPRIPGTCFLVKRAWFVRVGRFNEKVVFAEDMDLAERLHKAGARFAYLANIPFQTSLRRYTRDGYLRTGIRFLRAEWHMRIKGPITKELFPYGFDHAR